MFQTTSVTSSAVATILNHNPYQTKDELIFKKINKDKGYSPESEGQKWGKRYEDVCFYIFENNFSHLGELQHGEFIHHPKYPWMGGRTDGYCKEGRFLVEMKCPFIARNVYKIPFMYWMQVQVDLEIRNYDYGYLFTCDYCEYDTYEELKEHEVHTLFQLNNNHGKWNDTHKYWVLDKWSLIKIERDKIWFQTFLPFMDKFHNDYCNILQYLKDRKQSSITADEIKNYFDNHSSIMDKMTDSPNEIIDIKKIRNYTLNTPLKDWIDLNSFKWDDKTSLTFRFIGHKKSEFKDYVINHLECLYKDEMTILPSVTIASRFLALKTIEKIRGRMPIIANAHLIDEQYGIFTNIPLLIRGDYINKIFGIELCETIPSYHIVDISYKIIPYNADGIHIRNENDIGFYKAQMAYSNELLLTLMRILYNHVIKTPECFLIGRGSVNRCSGERIDEVFSSVGMFEFDEKYLNYLKSAIKGIEWYSDVQKYGADWKLGTVFKDVKIFPSKKYFDYWPEGKKIAKEAGDLSVLWNMNDRLYHKLETHGIHTWHDIKPENIDLFPNHMKTIINDMICINNQDSNSQSAIHIGNGANMRDLQLTGCGNIEYYVDFEVVNDLNNSLSSFPVINRVGTVIFMIGTVKCVNGVFADFRQFTIINPTLENEILLIKKWFKYISENNNYNGIKIFCWGDAEQTFLNTSLERALDYNLIEFNDIITVEWIDFTKIMKTAPIVINGCFSFKLKEVADVMYKHGLLSERWDDIYKNIDLMIHVWERNEEEIQKIGKYNRYDCEIMYEIISCIRNRINYLKL